MARPGNDFDRDILDIIPERFDADADSRQARAGHRLRTGITLAVAVVAVGGIVAGGLHFMGGRKIAGPGIPVIRADDRPIKTRPDDRGGMQVPNQDKLVYERMDGGEGGEKQVERLLPPPEQPKAVPRSAGSADPAAKPAATEMIRPPAKGEPPAPKAAPQPKVAVEEAVPPIAGPVTQPAQPAKPAPQVAAAPPPQAVKPAPQAVAPAPTPVPAPAPAPAAVTAPKAPPSGDYVIQLGAVRAADAADKEWARIQKANHDLLGALKADIVRVELEGKGTFWRVRAGPLSEAAARQLCAELTARSQGCILARK